MVLTVLRLWQPTVMLSVRLVAFTPWVPLALLVAGGLGLVLLGGWRRLVVTMLIAGLLGLHAYWLAPLFVGARQHEQVAASAGQDPHVIRVLTVNARLGQADPERIVEIVRNRGVDLLTVQEITDPLLAGLQEAGLNDLLPEHVGEPQAPPLGTMVFAAAPLTSGVAIHTGMQTWSTTMTTAQGDLRFMAVHPHAPITNVRAWAEAQRVLRAAAVDADVIAGDFNATLAHRPLLNLRADGFRSSAELTNAGLRFTWPAGGRFHLGPIGLPCMVQIDHILVRTSVWTAVNTAYVEIPGSDHTGVIADLVRR